MTYCLEILNLITMNKQLKLVDANYTANGIEAVLEDQFDKQKYHVHIKSNKEENIYVS